MTTERTTLGRVGRLTALAVDRARLASTVAERSEWFERMAHTDPLTGPRQRADLRPDPRARARPRRPPGQRGVARDVRRGRFPGDEPGRRPRGRRRRPASGGGRARRVGPPGGHGRAGRWRRVRAGRPGFGGSDRRADASWTGSPRFPPVGWPADLGFSRRGPIPESTAPTPTASSRWRQKVLPRHAPRGAGQWPVAACRRSEPQSGPALRLGGPGSEAPSRQVVPHRTDLRRTPRGPSPTMHFLSVLEIRHARSSGSRSSVNRPPGRPRSVSSPAGRRPSR